jgi:hypothetical protein
MAKKPKYQLVENPNEKKLPLLYNRRSRNKVTFDHIYYNFLSALVNMKTLEKLVMKDHLFKAMHAWITQNQYMENYDNKLRVSYAYNEKELELFKQQFTRKTFGIALDRCVINTQMPTTTSTTETETETVIVTTIPKINNAQSIKRVFKRDGIAYSINYDKLKQFLKYNQNYNKAYENDEVQKAFLPPSHFSAKNSYIGRYHEFFKNLYENTSTETFKISGLDLFKLVKAFIKPPIPTMTRFGVDMKKFLLDPKVAEKKYASSGTFYIFSMEKLQKKLTDT